MEAAALDILHGDFFFPSSVQLKFSLLQPVATDLKYCKDAIVRHVQLLPHCRAALYSQPQPQGCPKYRILHLPLLNFRMLQPGCVPMGPQPEFFRAGLSYYS